MEQINPNLLSKEELCRIIDKKDSEIQSLKSNIVNKAIKHSLYWQIVCFFILIPTILVSFNLPYSLQQKQINYGYFIVGVIASAYSFYKAFMCGKMSFMDEFEIHIKKEIHVEEMSTQELKYKLIEAEINEDYKHAIIIRDELKNRK